MPKIESFLNLDPELVEHFRKMKVFSLLDLINADVHKLTTPSLSVAEVLSLKHKLIMQYNKNYETGLSLYNICLKKSAVLPTDIKSLDDLLNGGLETGYLYEIAGLSGTGKTQLCFTIISSVILKLKRKVFFVDTKGDFSAKRILNIGTEMSSDAEMSLDRVEVFRASDFFDILSALYSIRDNLRSSKSYDHRLLILDSIAAPFYEHVGSPFFNQSYCILMEIGAILKRLASEMHLVVIVVNSAVRYSEINVDLTLDDANQNSDSKWRASLGRRWSHVPHTCLFLEQTDCPHVSLVTILKSNRHPIGKSVSVKILSQGVT